MYIHIYICILDNLHTLNNRIISLLANVCSPCLDFRFADQQSHKPHLDCWNVGGCTFGQFSIATWKIIYDSIQ